MLPLQVSRKIVIDVRMMNNELKETGEEVL
jgi:hypothetical protein